MKEDSAFHFKKRDWKVTPKQKSYYDNFDFIFRKNKKCEKCDDLLICTIYDGNCGCENKLNNKI